MSDKIIFLKNLNKFRNKKALILETGEEVSYAQLFKVSLLISSKLEKKKKLIFLLGKNNFETIAGYIAFVQKGYAIAIIDFKINNIFLKNLIRLYKPAYIFHPKKQKIPSGSYKKIFIFRTFLLSQNFKDKDYSIHENLMLLMSTSGTTGSPKFVRQSHEGVIDNTKNIVRYLKIKSNDKTITSLPFSYVYGLSVINSHLYSGSTLVLTDRSIIEKEFWDMVKKHKVNNFSGVPYSYSLIQRLGEKNLTNKLRYTTQAGGKMNYQLIKKIINIYKSKKIKFIQMYGSAEATSRMSYLNWKFASKKIGSIGKPIPGGKFLLKNSKGKIINKVNVKGELIYKGKNVCLGYAYSLNDLNLGDKNCGILNTGDIAYKDKEGFYYIIGRKNRYAKIFGIRVDLAELEEIFFKEGIDVVLKEGKENEIETYTEDLNKIKKILDNVSKLTSLNQRVFRIKKLLNKHLTRNLKYKV